MQNIWRMTLVGYILSPVEMEHVMEVMIKNYLKHYFKVNSNDDL